MYLLLIIFLSITNWFMCRCACQNHFEVKHISHVYSCTISQLVTLKKWK